MLEDNAITDSSAVHGALYKGDKFIRYILKKFIGLIQFSKPISKSTSKKGTIYKKFIPFFNYLPSMWVQTNKVAENQDTYALVELDEIDESGNIYAKVIQYYDKVNIWSSMYSLVKSLSTIGWSKKIDKMITGLDKKNACDLEYDVVDSRIDMTDKNIYSIDPKGTSDIDDAIHYESISDGYIIGIHIADVTSFFPLDSPIWKEMEKRSESIYLKDPIHMYPEMFSTNVASLREGKISRAFSLIINLDSKFKIKSYKLQRSYVKVKNMTYNEANDYISAIGSNDIKQLNNIITVINSEMFHKKHTDSHTMVELYMILANTLVAKYLIESKFYKDRQLPLVIRRQKESNTQLNVTYNKDIKFKEKDEIFGERIKYMKSSKAEYAFSSPSVEMNTHHGLGIESYTHFTSPIRRYADVVIHQMVHAVMYNDNKLIPEINIDTLFMLNHNHSHYRKCALFEEELYFLEELEDSYMDINCPVIDINDNKCRVIHEKSKHIFDVEIISDKLIDTHPIIEDLGDVSPKGISIDDVVRINIGDTIRVRVCYIPNGMRKLKAYVISPDVYNLLSIHGK
jgi:exoribonuclease R